MNNTTAELLISNVSNVSAAITTIINTTNHTSSGFNLIPMSLFTYLSLAIFKLYNSLF